MIRSTPAQVKMPIPVGVVERDGGGEYMVKLVGLKTNAAHMEWRRRRSSLKPQAKKGIIKQAQNYIKSRVGGHDVG